MRSLIRQPLFEGIRGNFRGKLIFRCILGHKIKFLRKYPANLPRKRIIYLCFIYVYESGDRSYCPLLQLTGAAIVGALYYCRLPIALFGRTSPSPQQQHLTFNGQIYIAIDLLYLISAILYLMLGTALSHGYDLSSVHV